MKLKKVKVTVLKWHRKYSKSDIHVETGDVIVGYMASKPNYLDVWFDEEKADPKNYIDLGNIVFEAFKETDHQVLTTKLGKFYVESY